MPVKTGKMPEKIIAVARYHAKVLQELHENEKNRNQIIENALNIVGKYFNFYMDNLARRDHMSFHHVYETGKTGQENARLFYYTISKNSGTPSINYQFKDATVAERSGQVFRKKAFVMEDGSPVIIKPKNGKYLVFDMNGEKMFAKKVFNPHPGGDQVAGSFADAFNMFMARNAQQILEDMGFYDKINKEISTESDVALSRINSGNLNSEGMAVDSANKIVKKVRK